MKITANITIKYDPGDATTKRQKEQEIKDAIADLIEGFASASFPGAYVAIERVGKVTIR